MRAPAGHLGGLAERLEEGAAVVMVTQLRRRSCGVSSTSLFDALRSIAQSSRSRKYLIQYSLALLP